MFKFIRTQFPLFIFFPFFLISCKNPELLINEPLNNSHVESKVVNVSGKIYPSDAELFVNGELVPLKEDGNFKFEVTLNDTLNKISFESKITSLYWVMRNSLISGENSLFLYENITIYRNPSIEEKEKIHKQEIRNKLQKEKIDKILSKTNPESIKKKYQNIINGCYGWSKFKVRKGYMSEYVFDLTKFDKIMQKKGFSPVSPMGSYIGNDGYFKVLINNGRAVASNSGWQHNWEITVEINKEIIY